MSLGPHLYLYDLQRRVPVDPEHAHQNMTNGTFMYYLYEHSSWIEGVFTYAIPITGGSLDEEHSVGEGQDEIFSREELERFLAELWNVPRPADEEAFLCWNDDHLLRLVSAALSRTHLTLVSVVQ